MKKILFKIGIIGIIMFNITKQACGQTCINNSNTNPLDNANPTSFKQNIWDWTSQYYGVAGGYFDGANGWFNINEFVPNTNNTITTEMYDNVGKVTSIQNPYYLDSDKLNPLNKGSNSDFFWEDGWEIITRNFGYSYNEQTADVTNDAVLPYFILYNKFTGVLRVFGMPLPGTQAGTINITISFLGSSDQGGNSADTYTGIFNNYNGNNPSNSLNSNINAIVSSPTPGSPLSPTATTLTTATSAGVNTSLALDMPTTINSITKQATFQGGGFFCYADFPMSYDPCTCYNSSAFLVQFALVTTGTISLTGSFLGSSMTIDEYLSGEYPPTPATTAGTNLTVQNGNQVVVNPQYVDQPNISAAPVNTFGNNQAFANNLMSIYNNLNPSSSLKGGVASGMADLSAAFAVTGNVTQAFGEASEDPETKAAGCALLAMSSLTSFVSTSLTSSNPPAPSVIQGSLSATGTTTVSTPSGNSDFYFANPGSPEAVTNEFYNSTTEIPNYPKYNEALGVFALLETPTVSAFASTFQQEQGSGYGARYEFQLTSPVYYMFNPAIGVDFNNTTITAALEIVQTGAGEYSSDLGSSDQDQEPIVTSGNIYDALTTTTTPTPGTIVSTTQYVPINELGNIVTSKSFYADLPPLNSSYAYYQVYLKIIVNLAATQTARAGGENHSLLMFTYPVNINPVNSPLSGFPFAPGDGEIWIPQTLTFPSGFTFPAATFNYPLDGSGDYQAFPVVNSDAIYVYNDVTIDGNVTATSGTGSITSMTGPITVAQGSTIGQGVSLQLLDSKINAKNANPLTTNYTGNLSSWCGHHSNPTGLNSYAANGLAPHVPNTRLSASNFSKPATSQELGSLSVYPNPFANFTTIKYTVPQAGNVELTLYDVMGNKIQDVQNGFQSSGNYTINFKSGNLEDGMYLLKINAGSFTETQKIVIVR